MVEAVNKSRRKIVLGGAALAAVGGAAWLKPGDQGGKHSEYFLNVQKALQEAGLYRPTLVIDRARMQANIKQLQAQLPKGKAYRVVAKSLPSTPLLQEVMASTGTERLMLFHQPFLNQAAKEFSKAHLLLGKPMPVGAAARFYQHFGGGDFAPAKQLEWLVDANHRLAQYQQLAAAQVANHGPMAINLELDVGLHRGGFKDTSTLAEALKTIQADPNLRFAGFMGYEPHISKMPGFLGGPEGALEQAMSFYSDCVQTAQEVLQADFKPETLTLNAGGSSTLGLYNEKLPPNELAMGSGLVKPTDFDVYTLDQYQAASFIATPVIKALEQTEIPGIEAAKGVFKAWDPNTARTFFAYGGHWLAQPESPPGLQANGIFGHSTNQMMFNGSASMQLAQDDFMFFRPSQSEFVFLQFGDVAIYDQGKITDLWPVFSEGA